MNEYWVNYQLLPLISSQSSGAIFIFNMDLLDEKQC